MCSIERGGGGTFTLFFSATPSGLVERRLRATNYISVSTHTVVSLFWVFDESVSGESVLYGRVAIWPRCSTFARDRETPINTMYLFLFLIETAVSLPARALFVGSVVGHLYLLLCDSVSAMSVSGRRR